MSVLIKPPNGSFTSSGGSAKGFPPGDCILIKTYFENSQVRIRWQDPEDTYIDNAVFVTWKGTILVRKEGSYPNSTKDGTIIVDSTIRNQYKDEFFIDTGLTNGTTYYYRFFTYSTDGSYNDSTTDSMIFKGTCENYNPVFGLNSWDNIHKAIENDLHTELWNIGDEIEVNYNSASVIYLNNSDVNSIYETNEGTVTYMIADFNRATGLTNEQFDAMSQDSSANSDGFSSSPEYLYKYPSENPKNIVLVVKYRNDILKAPLYFSDIWCYPGINSPMDIFASTMENYVDIPTEYLEDIMWRSYYETPTTIVKGNVPNGGVKRYWSKQKFLRLERNHIADDLKYFFGNHLSIFVDNNSRIYKDKNGNAGEYDLLSNVYVSNGTNSYRVNTNGAITYGRTSITEGDCRVMCVIK